VKCGGRRRFVEWPEALETALSGHFLCQHNSLPQCSTRSPVADAPQFSTASPASPDFMKHSSIAPVRHPTFNKERANPHAQNSVGQRRVAGDRDAGSGDQRQ
jgi:hypothetical protein